MAASFQWTDLGGAEMSYTIEFIPQLDEDGSFKGHTKVVLLAKRDGAMSEEDHYRMLAYVHRVSLVGSYWEEHMDEFVDYDFWYQNNNDLPASVGNLQ